MPSETIVMKVVSLNLQREEDKDGKATGKEYITINLHDIEAPLSGDTLSDWEMTNLHLRDRMTDLRLGQRVTVVITAG